MKTSNIYYILKNNFINRYQSFSAPFSERRQLLMIGDTFLVIISVLGAIFLWDRSSKVELDIFMLISNHWYWFPILITNWLVMGWFNKLYDIPRSYSKLINTLRVTFASGILLIIYTIVYMLNLTNLHFKFFFFFSGIAWISIIIWRLTYATLSGIFPLRHRILIAGTGKRGKSIARILEEDTRLNYKVIGFVAENSIKSLSTNYDQPLLGEVKDLPQIAKELQIHEVVIAIERNLEIDIFEPLVECQANGVRISSIPDLYEKFLYKTPIEQIDPGILIQMLEDKAIFNRLRLGIKRLIDLVFSALGLVMVLPVMLLVSLAIRIESPGPIFYRQIRSGRGRKTFSIIKFRSMFMNAEEDGKPRWASRRDKRITRVGGILRKTHLDEIPQLLNVLRGDMSLVGPRPERPEFIEQLEKEIPFYSTRLMVKPGVTGWAQVHQDYGNTIEDAKIKLQYDFYYLRHWSLRLDLYTIFQTLGTLFKLKGV